MSEWFEMGGYAAFVWPAWAISAGAVIVTVYLSIRAFLRTRKALAALENRR